MRPVDDFFFGGVFGVGAQHNHGLDRFSAIGVFGGDDAGFLHRRVTEEEGFDLGWPDFESARVDHAFEPIRHEEITVLIDATHVA